MISSPCPPLHCCHTIFIFFYLSVFILSHTVHFPTNQSIPRLLLKCSLLWVAILFFMYICSAFLHLVHLSLPIEYVLQSCTMPHYADLKSQFSLCINGFSSELSPYHSNITLTMSSPNTHTHTHKADMSYLGLKNVLALTSAVDYSEILADIEGEQETVPDLTTDSALKSSLVRFLAIFFAEPRPDWS